MRDTWAELGRHPLTREFFKKVGLKTPPQLLRAYRPWSDELLRGKRLLVNRGGFFDAAWTRAFGQLGAHIDRPPEEADSGERQPAPIAAYQGSLFDATAIETVAGLRQLFDYFQPQLRKMGFNHRVVIILRSGDRLSPERAACARAGEGFMRSLAKELGPKGVQVNAIYAAAAQAQFETLLPLAAYLLSDFSSFVTGQAFHLQSPLPGEHQSPSPLPSFGGSLAGKRALVTGAAQGIGYAIARRLAEEGAHVLCLDREANEKALSELALTIDGEAILCELGSDQSNERLADRLQQNLAPLDIVVHNAGVTRDRSLYAMRPTDWDQVLTINLDVPLKLSLELLRRGAIAPFGRIVTLSSIVGIAGNYGQSNYSAAKAGLIGLASTLSEHLRPQGITAHAVAPGFIETAMTAHLPFVAKQFARRLSSLAQGGLADDVAEMVCFLASPCSQGLSGQVVRVCGGNFLGA